MAMELSGYMGKILRVDLTDGSMKEETLEPDVADRYLGGSGFGAECLYREVAPGVEWDDPGNRIIMASGPMAGTVVSGSGTFSLVTKGPMTNLAVSTQAKRVGRGHNPAWHMDDFTQLLWSSSYHQPFFTMGSGWSKCEN